MRTQKELMRQRKWRQKTSVDWSFVFVSRVQTDQGGCCLIKERNFPCPSRKLVEVVNTEERHHSVCASDVEMHVLNVHCHPC